MSAKGKALREIFYRKGDPYRHISRIADALTVDENTSEALDDPDNAGTADALIAVREAGSTDALIAASPDLRGGGGRSGEPKSRQQQAAGDDRLLAHD